MATVLSVSGIPILEARKPPALIVSITTGKGRFSSRAPIHIGDAVAVEDQEVLENRLCDAADLVNGFLKEKLLGLSIADSRAVDEMLNNLEHEHMSPAVKLATSMACHQASAAEKDARMHRHMRSIASNAGEEASWDVTIPMVCMRTLDGEGDAGSAGSSAKYSVYLCPVGAEDPMSAVMMCGQVYRRIGNDITEAYGFDALKGGEEGVLLLPELASVDKSLASSLERARKAIRDEGLEQSVRLGVLLQGSEPSSDKAPEACQSLLSANDGLAFACVGDRMLVSSADGMESSRLVDFGDAATVSAMLDLCRKERDHSSVQLHVRQKVHQTTPEHIDALLAASAAMGSGLLLTCAPSKRFFQCFNELARIDYEENGQGTGRKVKYAGDRFTSKDAHGQCPSR